MNLQEILDNINRCEELDINLDTMVRYAIRSIVGAGDAAYFRAMPAKIKGEIECWIRDYQENGELQFLSGEGIEDLSDLMRHLVALLKENGQLW